MIDRGRLAESSIVNQCSAQGTVRHARLPDNCARTHYLGSNVLMVRKASVGGAVLELR